MYFIRVSVMSYPVVKSVLEYYFFRRGLTKLIFVRPKTHDPITARSTRVESNDIWIQDI